MSLEVCQTCEKNKTAITCDGCGSLTCKTCSYFVDEDSFEILELLPESIQGKTFCQVCYHSDVLNVINTAEEVLERAKNVNVYTDVQGTETRLIKRIEKPIIVRDCEDKDEALLRVAFKAAELGYDTIVDFSLKGNKVGKGTYKRQLWTGSGVPVDPNRRK